MAVKLPTTANHSIIISKADRLDRPNVSQPSPFTDMMTNCTSGMIKRQHDPVRPAQQAGVSPARPDRLGLGAHVAGEQDADYRRHPQIGIAPGADRHRADHQDVRISVEDVVQEIPPLRGSCQ